MTINQLSWDLLESYLRQARGQSTGSIINHKSRFKVMQEWLGEKDFDTRNFSIFLDEAEKSGKSPSYRNNCLKLAKHISFYFKNPDEFEEFKYADEGGGSPENVLSHQQISKLAECHVKYIRFKNRKIKHKALIYFLGHVGSRIDETLKLEWRDLEVGMIPLIRFRKEITKTNRERFCAIPKWICKMLLDLPKENEFIFSKIEDSNFREDLKIRRESCKISFHVTPHTFRDSSISNKLESGVPIQEVASYHGHVKIDTTFRYYARIQAKKVAKSLMTYDPAFSDDLTYEMNVQIARDDVEKTINPTVTKYEYNQFIDENGKKHTRIELIEK